MKQSEYYNFILHYPLPGNASTIKFVALTEKELNMIFDTIKRGGFAMRAIGQSDGPKKQPSSFQIFDFSKIPSLKNKNPEEIRDAFNKKKEEIGDYITTCLVW